MDMQDMKVLEELESDFHKVASQSQWTEQDIEKMKNIQKLMYYMEVRCAMKEGQEYPGSDYMEGMSRDSRSYNRGGNGGSYARNRNSYDDMRGNGSGRYMMPGRMTYPQSYGYNSGRRYYDSRREDPMDAMNHAMSMERDPKIREAMEEVMRMMEEE